MELQSHNHDETNEQSTVPHEKQDCVSQCQKNIQKDSQSTANVDCSSTVWTLTSELGNDLLLPTLQPEKMNPLDPSQAGTSHVLNVTPTETHTHSSEATGEYHAGYGAEPHQLDRHTNQQDRATPSGPQPSTMLQTGVSPDQPQWGSPFGPQPSAMLQTGVPSDQQQRGSPLGPQQWDTPLVQQQMGNLTYPQQLDYPFGPPQMGNPFAQQQISNAPGPRPSDYIFSQQQMGSPPGPIQSHNPYRQQQTGTLSGPQPWNNPHGPAHLGHTGPQQRCNTPGPQQLSSFPGQYAQQWGNSPVPQEWNNTSDPAQATPTVRQHPIASKQHEEIANPQFSIQYSTSQNSYGPTKHDYPHSSVTSGDRNVYQHEMQFGRTPRAQHELSGMSSANDGYLQPSTTTHFRSQQSQAGRDGMTAEQDDKRTLSSHPTDSEMTPKREQTSLHQPYQPANYSTPRTDTQTPVQTHTFQSAVNQPWVGGASPASPWQNFGQSFVPPRPFGVQPYAPTQSQSIRPDVVTSSGQPIRPQIPVQQNYRFSTPQQMQGNWPGSCLPTHMYSPGTFSPTQMSVPARSATNKELGANAASHMPYYSNMQRQSVQPEHVDSSTHASRFQERDVQHSHVHNVERHHDMQNQTSQPNAPEMKGFLTTGYSNIPGTEHNMYHSYQDIQNRMSGQMHGPQTPLHYAVPPHMQPNPGFTSYMPGFQVNQSPELHRPDYRAQESHMEFRRTCLSPQQENTRPYTTEPEAEAPAADKTPGSTTASGKMTPGKKESLREEERQSKPHALKTKEKEQVEEEEQEEEEEESPPRTVEVTVGGNLKGRDAYFDFFESKRNGGGEVEDIAIEEEKGVIYVTFKDTKVAERVSKKKFKDMQVKLYVPSKPKPTYQDKLLFQNVPDGISKNHLKIYLENVTGLKPKEILYGDSPGVVFVAFEVSPDFQRVQEKCKKSELEDRHLTVSRVAVSNCILVEGVSEHTTEEACLLYFENKRNRGAPVESVKMLEGEDPKCCLVYFEDHEAVDRVLGKRDHKIDGKVVKVKRHIECLGRSGGIEDPNNFELPESISLQDVDRFKTAFLQRSKKAMNELQKHLSKENAKIEFVDEMITIVCTLTKDLPKANSLAKTWTTEVRNVIGTYMGSLDVFEVEVMQAIFSDIVHSMEEEFDDKEEAIMVPLPDKSTIVVVGEKATAKNMREDVKNQVHDAEEELDRKNKEVVETKKVKPLQHRLLEELEFDKTVMKSYEHLTVDIRQEDIVFRGMVYEIRGAQVDMYQALDAVTQDTIQDMSERQRKLLQDATICSMIKERMKSENLVAVWIVDTTGVGVHATDEAAVKKAMLIIRKSVVEHEEPLTRESAQLLQSSEFKHLTKRLGKDHADKLLITPVPDDLKLFITGFDNVMHGVIEEVKIFLEENTIYAKVARFSPSRQKFILLHWQQKLQTIMSSLRANKVEITPCENDTKFYVKGTRRGLEQALGKLKELERGITCIEEAMTNPTRVKFMTSGKCSKDLEYLERTHKCVLSLEPEVSGMQVELAGSPPPDEPEETEILMETGASVDLPGGVKLSAVLADITQMEVDAIVNPANDKMDHKGGLAKIIVTKGGQQIQEESRRLLAERGGQLAESDVLVSGPGTLPCRAIIHAVGPKYNDGKCDEEALLHDTVINCLDLANNRHYSSLALPAISSGIFRYPVEEATSVIVKAIKNFLQTRPRHKIRNIYLCHLSPDTVEHFKRAMQRQFPDTQTTDTRMSGEGPVDRIDMASGASSRTYQQMLSEHGNVKKVLGTVPEYTASRHTTGIQNTVKIGIVEGEIAKETTEVIVNSAHGTLDLTKGSVSQSILKVAGPTLQAECRDEYPDGIKLGEIAQTGSHGLKCKEVYHLCLSAYAGAQSERLLQKVIEKCLQAACERGHTSIAFPVLGTGNLKFPPHVVAHVMLTTIRHFSPARASLTLKEAKIVVYHADKAILKELKTAQDNLVAAIPAALPGKQTAQAGRGRRGRKFSSTPDQENKPSHLVAGNEFDFMGLSLIIKQGDITGESVDAIVNSTNRQLNLRQGAVAKTLLAKCGERLTAECAAKVHEVQQTGIAVTRAFNMRSKFILHLDTQRFSADWETAFMLCLQCAETNNLTSLAVPALGTGAAFKSTPADSATALINTLTKFCSDKRKTLQELRVVIFEADMIPHFVNAIQALEKDRGGKGGIMKRARDAVASLFSSKPSSSHVPSQAVQDRGVHVQREVTLYVYASGNKQIREVLTALGDRAKETFTQKAVKHETLEWIDPLTMKEIEDICQRNEVDLHQQDEHCLMLDGLNSSTCDAYAEVMKILSKAEHRRQQETMATILKQVVQWYFLEVTNTGTEQEEYPAAQNQQIEEAYQRKQDTVSLKDNDGVEYIINFTSMKEYPKGNPGEVVSVIRSDKTKASAAVAGDVPPHWEPQNEVVKLVRLDKAGEEFKQVDTKFRASLKNKPADIAFIDRIQNPSLYAQYTVKKTQIEKQNGTGIQNERTMWHGTAPDAIPNINLYGFNRSYCGKNATKFGEGVYFAVNSSYSASPTYSHPDGSGNRFIYQCKVLAGHATAGNPGMRFLPKRESNILFDSATDSEQTPSMYIVFNDTQAYPEYLVTFK